MTTPEIPQQYASYLVADCGSSNTYVAMFDLVDGQYRFVAGANAPTTAGAPWSDIINGIQHAIQRISDTTGRPLLNDKGTLISPARVNGVGCDHFAATISAAEPLRCILVGLLDNVSLQSARHALNNIYADVVDTFSLADTRSEQEQMQAVAQIKPDLIFICGGTDGGADTRVLKLVETVALGVNMLNSISRPQIVYAGNARLREKVTEILGGLTTLHVAENVRPTLEVEQLNDAGRIVSDLYEDVRIGTVPGIAEVTDWSHLPLLPTSRALSMIIEYLAALYEGQVLGVDLGSDSVTLIAAEPGNVRVVVRSDLGMGRPITNILKESDPESIGRWVPTAVSPNEIRDFIHNKSLRPQTIPVTAEELYLEQAIARELMSRALAGAPASWRNGHNAGLPPFNLLLARGMPLASPPRPGQTILMLLDALQPTGIFSVALDRHGVLPALGALTMHEPLLVVQALEWGVLDDLGFVIVPTGRAADGQRVLTVRLENEATGRLVIEVKRGEIEVLPLPPGHSAELILEPARGIDIGFGPGRGRKVQVHGGAVGLVVDARGRPLPDFPDEEERQASLFQWMWDVGG